MLLLVSTTCQPFIYLTDLTKCNHYYARVGENVAVNWCFWPQFGMYILLSASASIDYCFFKRIWFIYQLRLGIA